MSVRGAQICMIQAVVWLLAAGAAAASGKGWLTLLLFALFAINTFGGLDS